MSADLREALSLAFVCAAVCAGVVVLYRAMAAEVREKRAARQRRSDAVAAVARQAGGVRGSRVTAEEAGPLVHFRSTEVIGTIPEIRVPWRWRPADDEGWFTHLESTVPHKALKPQAHLLFGFVADMPEATYCVNGPSHHWEQFRGTLYRAVTGDGRERHFRCEATSQDGVDRAAAAFDLYDAASREAGSGDAILRCGKRFVIVGPNLAGNDAAVEDESAARDFLAGCRRFAAEVRGGRTGISGVRP